MGPTKKANVPLDEALAIAGKKCVIHLFILSEYVYSILSILNLKGNIFRSVYMTLFYFS